MCGVLLATPLLRSGGMRSLLVCYFPREANKEMIRTAFAAFGSIESVYLVRAALPVQFVTVFTNAVYSRLPALTQELVGVWYIQ